MKHDDVDRLERACQLALAEALREHYSAQVEPRICHLMAKAAVTVLEAATDVKQ